MNMNFVNLVIWLVKNVGCGYIGWIVFKVMVCIGLREYGFIGVG